MLPLPRILSFDRLEIPVCRGEKRQEQIIEDGRHGANGVERTARAATIDGPLLVASGKVSSHLVLRFFVSGSCCLTLDISHNLMEPVSRSEIHVPK